jgi:MFS family permease
MGRSYGWVIVGAGALMGCVAIGALFSLAVFLQPMSEATGWSRTGISSAMTLDFLTMGVAAFGWGALSDRFGPRIVVLSGALLLGLGLALASRATSLLEFQLIYGIVVGRRRRGGVRADDRHCDRLVRQAPQRRRLAGLRGDGRGAHDHLALRAVVDLGA